jgi:hypothetical protein
MIEIRLTHGKIALIDDCDAHLAAYKWQSMEKPKSSGRFYARRRRLKREGPGSTRIYLHRNILSVSPGMEIDHINGDGLDCRRSNLRPALHRENCKNRRKNLSHIGPKGVQRVRGSRWRARIRTNGILIHLGYFDTEELAAEAYDRAAIRLHGDFARLNGGKES